MNAEKIYQQNLALKAVLVDWPRSGSGKRIIDFNVSANFQLAQLSPTDIVNYDQ